MEMQKQQNNYSQRYTVDDEAGCVMVLHVTQEPFNDHVGKYSGHNGANDRRCQIMTEVMLMNETKELK
jgi:hypothetical protein